MKRENSGRRTQPTYVHQVIGPLASDSLTRVHRTLRGRSGQVSFWAVFGLLLIVTAYLLQPQLFHDFVTYCVDYLFDTLDQFMGGGGENTGADDARGGK